MTGRPAREAVQAFLARIEAQDAMDVEDGAVAHVVSVYDPETKRATLYGPYDDPVAACAGAQLAEDALNGHLDPDEPEYVITVQAVQPRWGQPSRPETPDA